ncbi:MAG TPA: hypothetical protein DEP91_01900 [Sphingomonas bacterium]|uniref:WalW protein n=1 Tax=Sphingomonas bacterium TaxID=1895847 RepID=A0A3D0W857_9SPHN|nr:hypothetical protein [Sphingomonas bacterium]
MSTASWPAAVAPPTGPRFRWPAGFGTRFAICIDTEEEFDWNAAFDRQATAVTAIRALPAMHRRFADRGVPLTYLTDYPVASTPEAADTIARLLEDGVSAVGAHLHPWVTPPHEEVVSRPHSFAGNLPPALEGAKLDALGAAIEAVVGGDPVTAGVELAAIAEDNLAIPTLRQLAKRLIALADMRREVESGDAAAVVVKRHRVFWKEEAATIRALQRWNAAQLARAVERVRTAERAIVAPGNAGAILAEVEGLAIARMGQRLG